MIKKTSLFTLMFISAFTSKAATLSETIDGFFKPIVDNYLVPVIFWDPIKALGLDVGASVPIVVVWLVFGAIYFTFSMNFINFRGFKHAIGLVKGDYDDPSDKGEVSHFQALTTALSATVGLGNIAGVAIAISIGDPASALILLAGVYYGAIFGGSTSSILINAPGVAGTVATSFDGYPLARAGKAGKALTIAAISSFIGGTFGAILLFGFAPFLSKVALSFHSSEYFALMVLGLSAIAAFAGKGQVAKALMMAILGIMLATVGETALFNAPRFTAGIMNFQSGVGFITLAMAMFALPEAIYLILDPLRSKTKSGSKG